MKWKKIMALMVMICLVGCENKTPLKTLHNIERRTVITESLQQHPLKILKDKDFLNFFKNYFNLNTEEMIIFNRRVLNEVQQKTFKNKCNKNKELETINLLEWKNYFDLPRFITVGRYTVGETIEVEKTHIIALKELGQNKKYEVQVISKNAAFPTKIFNEFYQWDPKVAYYIYLDNKGKNQIVPDTVRIARNYWVEVIENQKSFKIKSVKEANAIHVDSSYQLKTEYNQNTEQLPYWETPNPSQYKVIQMAMKNIYSCKRSNQLNSCKNDREYIEPDLEKLEVHGMPISSNQHPLFQINIPVNVLLNNNQVIYYKYYYQVELDKCLVKKISLIGIEKQTT